MVGAPKRLEDLRRIKAGVEVTCRTCGRKRRFGRTLLIRELTRRGHSTDWGSLPHRLRCSCGSKDVRVLPVPFSEEERDGILLFGTLTGTVRRCMDVLARQLSIERDQELTAAVAALEQAKAAMQAWIISVSPQGWCE